MRLLNPENEVSILSQKSLKINLEIFQSHLKLQKSRG